MIGKSLSCLILKHTSTVRRSPVSLSLSLHFFSTLKETQLGISPAVSDILLHKYDFPPAFASRVASELTRLRNPEKADSILSFLKQSGFSNTQLQKIVKYRPRILAGSHEDRIKPKIKIFQDLGLSSNDICKLISSNPTILHLSLDDNIVPSLSVMKGLLGSDYDVGRVLRRSPWFLTVNLGNTVLPNVEFLKSFGVSMERIRSILTNFPNPFLVNPEVMRKSAEKAKEMGLDASSKSFVYAIPTIASISNELWEIKLQAFRDLGFSDSDILIMFRKTPRMFCGSMEKIKKVNEFLLATGKFSMSCIVNDPLSLKFSVEERYIPRVRILEILESRSLIKKWPALGTICRLSDIMFFKRYISPCVNGISDVDITKSFGRGKREIKP